jgi:hypothetical protein
MIDLNTVIPPHPNLQLTYAVAINDRGEIAGFGVPPGCAPQDHGKCGHAYVLIPCKEGENCKNVTLGGSSSVPFSQPMGQTTEPSATKASSVLDKARIRIQQSMHLPGQRTVPSD